MVTPAEPGCAPASGIGVTSASAHDAADLRSSQTAHRSIALTAYPLSAGYRTALSTHLATPLDYLSLTELRRLPLRKMIAELRGQRADTIYLPLEDANSTPLLPVLACIAKITGASAIISI